MNWSATCKPVTVSPSGGLVTCSRPIGQLSATNPAAPIRPVSKCGSRTLPRQGYAMAIGVFMSCCGEKDGRSTTKRPGGSIGNWACNCATRHPNARSRQSCGKTEFRQRLPTSAGRWTSYPTSCSMAGRSGFCRSSTTTPACRRRSTFASATAAAT